MAKQGKLGTLQLKQEEFDPAPILTSSIMEAASSVVGGSGKTKTKKTMLDDEDDPDEEDLDGDIEDDDAPVSEDVFMPVIKKLMVSQSPTVRSAIEGTSCFARVWYSADDKDYCPEMECGLRKLCEAAYHQAIESVEADVEAKEEMEGVGSSEVEKLLNVINGKEDVEEDDLAKVKQNRKLQTQKKKVRKSQAKDPNGLKKVRRPYVDQGRPVDYLAKVLHDGLDPKELPDNWIYANIGTKEERLHAAAWFVGKYGDGIQHSKRAGYHVYFYEGKHLLRFWVNAAGGGWLDMNPHLAEEMEKSGAFKTEVTPVKNPRHRYNFFPKRIKIRTAMQMETLIGAIKLTLSKMVVQ